jgi:LuxR family maltose regulon positive regulatory protein
LAEARAWAEAQGPASELAPSYVDAYAHLTVARVLLADFRAEGGEAAVHDATELLERIGGLAAEAGWLGIVLETRVLQALAHQAAGDDEAALDAILAALRIAEPEGHQAVFLDEGPALAGLLRGAAQAGAGKRQVRRLQQAASAPARRPRVLPDFVEPLSDRERDVLRLLSGDMSGPQIARELGMSVHTLRSHTKNIYAKLGVHGRREAVRRGSELGLD